jgi:hypothetical protein
LKSGWDVRFVPVTNAQDVRDNGFSIVAWPKYAGQ